MTLDTIRVHCKALRLPTVAQVVEQSLVTAQREEWTLETFLEHLLDCLFFEYWMFSLITDLRTSVMDPFI